MNTQYRPGDDTGNMQPSGLSSSTEQNTKNGRRMFEDMLGKADFDLADDILASDIIMHHPSSSAPIAGVNNVVGFLSAFRAGFPDMTMKVELAFGDGEMVAIRWRMSGTHTSLLFGIPPSGKSVTVSGISLLRFVNGKVVEDWVSEDTLGLMQQIGAIPV